MTIDSYYVFASSVSALVARFLTYPMDTIKTRIQTDHVGYESINDVNKPRHGLHRFLSLYSGLTITLLFSVPALSTYLCFYEFTKEYLSTPLGRDNLINHAISGTVAEMTAGLFFTPMEVVKSQMQIRPLTTKQITYAILKEDGFRGFFKGYWWSLAVFLPHTIIYFVVYEQLKLIMPEKNFFVFFVCSTIAGCLGVVASTPFDVIKTRWQVSAQEEAYRVGPLQIAKHMYSNDGFRPFTKGMLARMAWGIPTMTISMTLFETLLDAHK
ncbi:mitochondrial carrier [Backusella circina FSU 941]|nr:mitochondrial carrier [Backusella circina FSU 941]